MNSKVKDNHINRKKKKRIQKKDKMDISISNRKSDQLLYSKRKSNQIRVNKKISLRSDTQAYSDTDLSDFSAKKKMLKEYTHKSKYRKNENISKNDNLKVKEPDSKMIHKRSLAMLLKIKKKVKKTKINITSEKSIQIKNGNDVKSQKSINSTGKEKKEKINFKLKRFSKFQTRKYGFKAKHKEKIKLDLNRVKSHKMTPRKPKQSKKNCSNNNTTKPVDDSIFSDNFTESMSSDNSIKEVKNESDKRIIPQLKINNPKIIRIHQEKEDDIQEYKLPMEKNWTQTKISEDRKHYKKNRNKFSTSCLISNTKNKCIEKFQNLYYKLELSKLQNYIYEINLSKIMSNIESKEFAKITNL
jgi:hypothetical protein